MPANAKRFLLLIFCSAALLCVAAEVLDNTVVQFVAARADSAVAPPEFLAQPGASEISCGCMCSLRSGCFGFYWLLGACRLFDLQAFFNASAWVSTGTCDVFVLDYRKLPTVSCNQSSKTYCHLAIDGNTDSNYGHGFCSDTEFEPGAWWEATLAAPSVVSFVTIYNRQDCCAERLNIFDLQVDGSVCNQVNLSEPFAVATFTCNAVGSRVRIVSRSDPATCLTICEFMAFSLVSP